MLAMQQLLLQPLQQHQATMLLQRWSKMRMVDLMALS
nr:MAG TPA: hypothetical protein [Caudoviricetes sp.]